MEIANIDSSGVERRLRNAVLALAGTLVLVVALQAMAAPAWAYLALVVPFWGVFFLVYQALFKTCAFMGSRGERDFGDGREKVADPAQVCALRARAARVMLLTIGTALAATVGVFLAVRL